MFRFISRAVLTVVLASAAFGAIAGCGSATVDAAGHEYRAGLPVDYHVPPDICDEVIAIAERPAWLVKEVIAVAKRPTMVTDRAGAPTENGTKSGL